MLSRFVDFKLLSFSVIFQNKNAKVESTLTFWFANRVYTEDSIKFQKNSENCLMGLALCFTKMEGFTKVTGLMGRDAAAAD